jgi:hypothetical protein
MAGDSMEQFLIVHGGLGHLGLFESWSLMLWLLELVQLLVERVHSGL